MRAEIHPNYNEIKVTCSCGNVFNTRSTLAEDFHVEICSTCHPFYTGKQKIMDTGGRVKRFEDRYKKQSQPAPTKEAPVKAEASTPAKPAADKPKAAPKKPAATKTTAKKGSDTPKEQATTNKSAETEADKSEET